MPIVHRNLSYTLKLDKLSQLYHQQRYNHTCWLNEQTIIIETRV